MWCSQYEDPTPEEQVHMSRCWHYEKKGVIVANPVVFVSSFVVLWCFIIACCVEPDYMGKAMGTVAWGWIPEVWTWLYIVSQDIWVVILIWVMVAHGRIKLGKDDQEPDYSLATWFSMLFCCGLATGLFYYSVAEPMWHYKGYGNPRFSSRVKDYGNEDEDATLALVVTLYHWGVHGWIAYTTMGAVLGLMAHRRGFPMTIRYCFWPLIGEACYGWMGDFVDALSIITSISGVCTSLGLGAMQLNAGLQRLSHGFYRGINYAVPAEDRFSTPDCGGTGKVCAYGKETYGVQQNVGTQIFIIVVITCMATASVITGTNVGIKILSQFVFAMGNGLMLIILFSGETSFCLDAMVQSLGYYVWYLPRLGFYCDAFERLGEKDLGLGGAPNGKGGSASWLSSWTLFYWGWWISWGPLVGTFLAKISRGRTLRQFVVCTLIVPTLYCVVWFGVWGSEGIRMQRVADGGGLCEAAKSKDAGLCSVPPDQVGQVSSTCFAFAATYSDEKKRELGMGWNPKCVLDPHYHGGLGRCQEFAWSRWEPVGSKCVIHTSWHSLPCGGGEDPTAMKYEHKYGACAGKLTESTVNGSGRLYNLHPPDEQPACFQPLQDSAVCLYAQATEDILFDQISSYGSRSFSDFLSAVTIACLALYFVTSSDSGSLVVDILSANGHPEPPVFQRIFWSMTEGTTAIALLYSGINSPDSSASLKALQAASIICGLPYTFIMFWCSQSLLLLCQEESGSLDPKRKAFDVFLFNTKLWRRHVVNTLAPGIVAGRAVALCGKWPLSGSNAYVTQKLWTVAFMGLYWLAIVFLFAGLGLSVWCSVGLSLYSGFGVLLGLLRNGVRLTYGIRHGDLITDLLCGVFVPMFTISQIEEQMLHDKKVDPPVQTRQVHLSGGGGNGIGDTENGCKHSSTGANGSSAPAKTAAGLAAEAFQELSGPRGAGQGDWDSPSPGNGQAPPQLVGAPALRDPEEDDRRGFVANSSSRFFSGIGSNRSTSKRSLGCLSFLTTQ